MKLLAKLAFLLALTVATNLQAYTVFSFDRSFSYKRPTDVFVVGYGKEAGTLFLNTAISRARKQLDTFGSSRQILVLWAKEDGQSPDTALVKRLGFNILQATNVDLSMNTTIAWLDELKEITSLHFVGHSSALHGFGLQKSQRFNQDKNKLSKLKRNFADGAYIFLHGCNTGFNSAPELSEILEVPTFGSMTSTDFQQLHNDGTWYWNNKGQYPAGGWSPSNNLSLANSKSCSGYACYRLKANNHPYAGSWGRYETGLSFHKAFCNFDLGKTGLFSRKKGIDVCYQGLWNAIKTWPSTEILRNWTDRETYKEIITDFLCPKISGYGVDKACAEVLAAADRGVISSTKFYWGPQYQCNFKGCNWGTKTQQTEENGRVSVFTGTDAGNSTIVNEYRLYMKLFELYR